MNIVITGGLGYVGSVLLEELKLYDFRNDFITIVDCCKRGGLSYLPYMWDYRFVDTDLTKQIPKCIKEADIVIHLAGMVGFPACDADPSGSEKLNIGVTRNIVNSMKSDARLIFASTTSVYGDVDTLSEDVICNPKSRYAAQKLTAEEFVSERPHTIFRFATAFGLSPNMRYDLLPHTLVCDAIKNGYVAVFEPQAIRSFIHVNDMAIQLINACIFSNYANQILNAGFTQNEMTKADIATLVSKYTGAVVFQGEFNSDPEKRGKSVDFSKLYNLNRDYKPVTLESGIKSLVEYKSLYLK